MQYKSCQHTVKRSRRCQASTKQDQGVENKNPNIGDKPEDEVDMEVSWSSDLLMFGCVAVHLCNFLTFAQNPDSEMAQKQAEQDRLRKAEKFMKIGTGQAECMACGYAYDPKKGDSEYPVSPGTKFEVPCSPVQFLHCTSFSLLIACVQQDSTGSTDSQPANLCLSHVKFVTVCKLAAEPAKGLAVPHLWR